MSATFKKILMSATALVAVAAMPQHADANPRTISSVGTEYWGGTGTPNCKGTTVDSACGGDDVSFTLTSGTADLNIWNDGTSYDGSGSGIFIVGKITDTAGGIGNVNVYNPEGFSGSDMNTTIFDVQIAGDLTAQNIANASPAVSTLSITQDVDLGGALTVNAGGISASATQNVTIGGTLTVDGTSTLQGSTNGIVAVTVNGNATFNDQLDVTAANNGKATLTLNGATNSFVGGVVLGETGTGQSTLAFSDNFAQTVTGTIDGAGLGQGSLLVENSAGVTFNSAIGDNYALDDISIHGNGAFNSSATFNGDVKAGDIILGDATGTDTNTLTFNSTGGNITVEANIYGGGGTDVNKVVISGGKLVTVNGDWGASGALDSVTLSANTSLYLGGTATNITNGITFAGAGGTLTVGTGEDLGADVTANGNYGTLTLEGGTQFVTSNIGTTNALLAVNAGATGGASVFSGTVKATTLNVTGTGSVYLGTGITGSIAFGGNNGTVVIDNGSTVTGTVNTTTASTGTLSLINGGNTVTGAVGGTKALQAVYAGNGGSADTFSSTVNTDTLFVNGTGTVNLNKGLTGDLDFANFAGAVNVASGFTVSGDITSTGGNNGTLSLLGGSQAIAGAVGGVGTGLSVINAGQSGGATVFSNATQAVYAATLNVGSGSVTLDGGLVGSAALGATGGTLTLASGMDITGGVSATGGTGTLVLLGGTQTIGGAVGSLSILNANVAGSNTTFSSTVKAATINTGAASSVTDFVGLVTATDLNISGTGTVNLGAGLTGSAHFLGDGVLTVDNASKITGVVTTITNNAGTLQLLNGGNTVSGQVGALAAALKEVDAGDTGVDTFSSNVYATTLNVTGAGTVAMSGMTGKIDLSGNGGTVTMASGTDITGSVDNSTGNGGTLMMLGSTQKVTGLVGATGALALVTAGSAGGDTTFMSYVKAATLDVGNGSVTLNGLTGDIDFVGNNGTVNLSSGTTVTGNIDNGISSGGTLNLQGGNQAIAGLVGATGALSLINTGVTGSNAVFSKAVQATTIDINGTGSVQFNDDVTGSVYFNDNGTVHLAGGKTFTGDIDNALASPATGTFIFDSSASMIGDIGATGPLKALTLAGTGGTVGTNGIGQLVTVAGGNVNIADTTSLGGNTLAITGGSVYSVSGQTIQTQMTGAVSAGTVATGGNITSSGAATIAAGTKVDVSVQSLTSYVQDLATFTVVDGTGGAGVGAVTITDNSYLFNFTQGASTSDLDLVVHRVSLASLGSNWNNVQVGNALDTIGAGATGSLLAAQVALQNAPNATAFNNILSRLLPTVDNSAQVASLNVGGVVSSIVETRMADLRQNNVGGPLMAMSGVSAGYDDGFISGENVWGQFYGQAATQDNDSKTGVAGYTSNTYGMAFGVDSTNVLNGAVVGVAFNYAKTDADSKNLNTTSTGVDSYGLGLYTSYDLGSEMFFNGQVGYAHNSISSERHNVVAANDTASADYDGDQYSARAAIGDDIAVDYAMTMSPSISLDYTHLSNGSYAETGIGTAGLSVDSQDYNLFKAGIGLNTEWNVRNYDGSVVKPAVRLGYSYDIVNDNIETTSRFIGAPGTSFVTRGIDPSPHTFNVGGGLTYLTTSNWDLSANYDYTYKDKYSAHAGVARATARF